MPDTYVNAERLGYFKNKVDEKIEADLSSKADKTGSYPDLTAGNAAQLIGTVYTEDKTPYKYRTTGGSIDVGNRADDTIVGGSVVWNQNLEGDFSNQANWVDIAAHSTHSVADGVLTVTAATAGSAKGCKFINYKLIGTHTYLTRGYVKSSSNTQIRFGATSNAAGAVLIPKVMNIEPNTLTVYEHVLKTGQSTATGTPIYTDAANRQAVGDTVELSKWQLFDLTQMFGPTIADYIYSLEQATAGAGVAWFRKLFPDDYYPYNPGEIMSVSGLTSHDTVGFNAFDLGTGTAKVVKDQSYQISGTYTALSLGGETISPDVSGIFTPSQDGTLTVTGGGSDTCIHLQWSGYRNGEYEPYVKHSYPLDSTLTLRGIPQLDANNNLYYDGDTYESDGTVTRKYGIVDLGTLTWSYSSAIERFASYANPEDAASSNRVDMHWRCSKYETSVKAYMDTDRTYNVITVSDRQILVRDSSYTDAATFKAAMSGVYLVYELATTTTETADPYTNPQIIDDFGTEEYVTDSIVPVGHVTKYPENLRDKLQHLPDLASTDGSYLLTQSNKKMSLSPYVAPTIPTPDTTLTVEGGYAEAKTVGDEISGLKEDISELESQINQLEYEDSKQPTTKGTASQTADLYITDTSGNVLAEFSGGHFKVKNFDSSLIPTVQEFAEIIENIEDLQKESAYESVTKSTTASNIDLDLVDASGNVLVRLAEGHIQTKNFDSSRTDQNAVKSVNNTLPDANGNVDVIAQLDPEELQDAVDTYLGEHPVVAAAAGIVSVADYGAVGDGVTDDSAKIQNAIDANYDVYFESGKTYYIASSIDITHDCRLHGGRGTVIKTSTPSGGVVNSGFVINGTLKKTTTFTTDYTTTGATANAGNRITLSDMTDINIGDILVIKATDQYYSLARQYYYLGATLVVTDIYDGHLYVNIGIPWDIENTANVSVKVYAPVTAIVENLKFVSDLDSRGSYRYAIGLQHTTNSIVRNCTITEWDNDIQVYESVNTLIEDVSMSKSKYDNSLSGDGYGVSISGSTNTVIRRVIAMCGQHCVTTGGQIPVINTFVKECNMSSECRVPAFDNHENAYNTVLEDSSFGGISLCGTAIVSRCRIFEGNRIGSPGAIILYGSHKPEFARYRIENCEIDGNLSFSLNSPSVQDPIRSFDSVIDSVYIENLIGGTLRVYNRGGSNILSETVNKLIVHNWQKGFRIYHNPSTYIKHMEIGDSTFTREDTWIMEDNSNVGYSGIQFLRRYSTYPKYERLFGDLQKHSGRYVLPQGVPITFESSDVNSHYIVCGKNLASNDSDDYSVGSVSATVGQALTRTPNANFSSALVSVNDTLVFTQPNNTISVAVYPKCLFYVDESSSVKIFAKLKNTGNTSGATFRPYIVAINCDTGLVTIKSDGTAITATADGADIEHSYGIGANSIVLCYLFCNIPIANAETTIDNFVVKPMPRYFTDEFTYETYNGTNMDGDGTLYSIDGVNNVLATSEAFSAKFKVNMEV